MPAACPTSNCFNGSVTLDDCTCRCDNGRTGADCSVCARACQHGGQLDPQACQCICPLGYSGVNCEIGYATTPLATCTGSAVTVTYTGTSIQQGSFIGIYALNQTGPFNFVAEYGKAYDELRMLRNNKIYDILSDIKNEEDNTARKSAARTPRPACCAPRTAP